MDRFWSKVNKNTDTGCWEWTACTVGDGYGKFMINQRNYRAHRLSWMMHHNQIIPAGMVIMHTCDNPGCVKPEHLVMGTQQDNITDKMNKGRHVFPRGESLPAAKLANQDVLEIRALRGCAKQGDIAAVYGISRACVCQIQKGKAWAHLP